MEGPGVDLYETLGKDIITYILSFIPFELAPSPFWQVLVVDKFWRHQLSPRINYVDPTNMFLKWWITKKEDCLDFPPRVSLRDFFHPIPCFCQKEQFGRFVDMAHEANKVQVMGALLELVDPTQECLSSLPCTEREAGFRFRWWIKDAYEQGHIDMVIMLCKHKDGSYSKSRHHQFFRNAAKDGHLKLVNFCLEEYLASMSFHRFVQEILSLRNYYLIRLPSRKGHTQVVDLFLNQLPRMHLKSLLVGVGKGSRSLLSRLPPEMFDLLSCYVVSGHLVDFTAVTAVDYEGLRLALQRGHRETAAVLRDFLARSPTYDKHFSRWIQSPL